MSNKTTLKTPATLKLKYDIKEGKGYSPKATALTFDGESNKPKSRNPQSSSTCG
jgi:hypothetical protein